MGSKAELESGDTVSRYQLVSPIGVGGMGKVWVALDRAAPALRLVALKTALRESGNDGEFWAALSDEATLASRIQHPNVCSTYEFGDAEGTHYLVMEWSDGASLRDLLDALPTHRLEPVVAANIVASVAAGLHAAHELAGDDGEPLGVVHRDVSPQNVLLSSRGHVRLADFGVAKARGQAHRPTETGEVKGKLSYMAPEQVASKNIDRRADIFALGCVLYEAVLGVRPFHGADALATMYKILEQDLTLPHTVDPDFPPDLERILVKALAKAPGNRYGTAEEFRAELLAFIVSSRRYVANKHTADLLDQTLGATLRQRNSAILDLAQRLRRGETDPAKLLAVPPPPPQHTTTPEGGIERTISVLQAGRSAPPGRAGKRFTILTGVAFVAVAVAAVFAIRSWHKPAPSIASAPAASAAPPLALSGGAPFSSSTGAEPNATAVTTPAATTTSGLSDRPKPDPHHGGPRVSVKPNVWHAPSGPLGVASSVPISAPSATGKAAGRTPRSLDRSNPFLTTP